MSLAALLYCSCTHAKMDYLIVFDDCGECSTTPVSTTWVGPQVGAPWSAH